MHLVTVNNLLQILVGAGSSPAGCRPTAGIIKQTFVDLRTGEQGLEQKRSNPRLLKARDKAQEDTLAWPAAPR